MAQFSVFHFAFQTNKYILTDRNADRHWESLILILTLVLLGQDPSAATGDSSTGWVPARFLT